MRQTAGTASVWVNKSALVAVSVAATTLGTLPWVLVFRRPEFLFAFAIWSAILAYLPLRSFDTFAHRKPSFREFVAGGIGTLSQPAAATLMGLICGMGLRYLARGFNALAGWLEWAARLPVQAMELYGGLVVVLLLLSAVGTWSRNLAKQLYPQLAGVPTAFFEYVYGRKRQALRLALLVLVGLALVIAVLDPLAPGFVRSAPVNIVLAAIVITVARPLSELGEGTQPAEYGRAVDAVRKLFEKSGYQCVPAPRTGQAGIDPLLANVDLYAEGAEASYVVDVKLAGAGAGAWEVLQEASDIATAAWALGQMDSTAGQESEGGARQVARQDGAGRGIEPLLVLVGERDQGLLEALGQKSGVRVAALADRALVDRILASEDDGEMRKIAARDLEIPAFAPVIPAEPGERADGVPA